MTAVARNLPRMSVDEYLRTERQSPRKHEFVDGIVYAMAGASRRHNDIATDLHGVLRRRLSAPCRPYALDVQVHIKTQDEEHFYYPDVVVTCSDLDNDEYLIKLPSLVVEVLSHTTEEFDRGDKFNDYRKLPSLHEYVLVHQARLCVELYRRRTNWEKEIYEAGSEVVLESIRLNLAVEDFYTNVRF